MRRNIRNATQPNLHYTHIPLNIVSVHRVQFYRLWFCFHLCCKRSGDSITLDTSMDFNGACYGLFEEPVQTFKYRPKETERPVLESGTFEIQARTVTTT